MIRSSRAIGALVLATSLALGATACSSDSSGQSAGASVQVGQQVAPQAFADYAGQAGVVILDVRTPEEFASGHLPGAVNLDVEGADFESGLTKLDQGASYAVYCRSGNRSRVALEKMAADGFAHTMGLDGGIGAWSQAGGAVVTG